VGVSIGVERIFSLLEAKANTSDNKTRTTETEVYVVAAQKNLLEERMKICAELWDKNVKAETSYKKSPKLLTQFQHCENMQIPIALVIGESEIASGVVKLRNTSTREEREVSRADMYEEIQSDLRRIQGDVASSQS